MLTDNAPTVFALPLDGLPSLTRVLPETGLSSEAPARILARALASSPMWAEMGEATLVIRSDPAVLGVFGRFDDRATARLESLFGQLGKELPRLRYVDYRQVEADCEELAARLIEVLGRDVIRDAGFLAIPRGGMIVLGILAYLLELDPAQLAIPSKRSDRPCVVVDDCSLSGARFRGFLAQLPERSVVFATLYAHPDLRDAIETSETRVETVVSARDLHDHAPVLHGPGYPAWKKRWESRTRGEAYWIGHPEHLCFPWNEPDLGFWNPVAQRKEVGWRLVPPELCLKNRVAAAGPKTPRIQEQPHAETPLSPASSTLFARFQDRVLVANYETGEVVELTGVAAAMWTGIIEEGDPGRIVETLSGEYEADEAILKRDLAALIEEMERRGFLASTQRSKSD